MKRNNKGFTLIELLAVIVIMGILMIVAIPQVTKYIENSKKDTYADTAKAYINSARFMLLNDEYDCTLPEDTSTNIYIPLDQIDIEQGGEQSPYNQTINKTSSFVKVQKSGEKYVYSIFITDAKKNGSNGLVEETKLARGTFKKQGAPATSPSGTKCTKATT